jgi:hypothetical protein
MEDFNANAEEKQEKKSGFKNLTGHIEQLAGTWYRLMLVKITQKATLISSNLLAAFAALFFGFFVMLFGGFALAWWLGDLLDNRVAGFLLVAGLFLLIMVVIILLRKRIVFPFFRDLIIRKIYDTKD